MHIQCKTFDNLKSRNNISLAQSSSVSALTLLGISKAVVISLNARLDLHIVLNVAFFSASESQYHAGYCLHRPYLYLLLPVNCCTSLDSDICQLLNCLWYLMLST